MPLGTGGVGHQPPLRMLATPGPVIMCLCVIASFVERSRLAKQGGLPSSGWAIGQAISGLWDYISMER